MPEGSAVLSVEFKINMMAPASPDLGTFVARGRVVRMGRTIGVATAEVIALGPRSSKGEVCIALMQATMMRVEPMNGTGG